jgi:hypothetical protein
MKLNETNKYTRFFENGSQYVMLPLDLENVGPPNERFNEPIVRLDCLPMIL